MLPGEDLQGWGTEVYPGKSTRFPIPHGLPCADRHEQVSTPTTTSTCSACELTPTSMGLTIPSSCPTPWRQTRLLAARRISTATPSTQSAQSSSLRVRPRLTTMGRLLGPGTCPTRTSCTRTARSPPHISSSVERCQVCFLRMVRWYGRGLDSRGMLYMLPSVRLNLDWKPPRP